MTHWPQFSHLKTQTTQQHHVLISRVMFETLFRHVHCYGDQVFLQLHLYFDSSLSQGYQHKAYSSAKFHSLKKGYSPNFIHKRSVYSSWGAQNKPLKTRFWLNSVKSGKNWPHRYICRCWYTSFFRSYILFYTFFLFEEKVETIKKNIQQQTKSSKECVWQRSRGVTI